MGGGPSLSETIQMEQERQRREKYWSDFFTNFEKTDAVNRTEAQYTEALRFYDEMKQTDKWKQTNLEFEEYKQRKKKDFDERNLAEIRLNQQQARLDINKNTMLGGGVPQGNKTLLGA